MAEIDTFLSGLPQRYDTNLGEETKLSGGQKQRIGIARVLIRDPRVLILDEATASLDSRAEEAILRTIEKVREGRTVLSIAHRLLAVVNSDVIFVLKDGELVDQGTHTELLERPGLYRQMWEEQTRGRPDVFENGASERNNHGDTEGTESTQKGEKKPESREQLRPLRPSLETPG